MAARMRCGLAILLAFLATAVVAVAPMTGCWLYAGAGLAAVSGGPDSEARFMGLMLLLAAFGAAFGGSGA